MSALPVRGSGPEVIHIGESTEEVTLSVADLVVDERYQRPLSIRWARTIAKEFDPGKFGKPLVARRPDGKYSIIDGQHRIWAVRMKWPKQVVTVRCDLMLAEGLAKEAGRFNDRNVRTHSVGSIPQFRSLLAEGDRDAVGFKGIVERYGYRVKSGGGRPRPGEIHPYVLKQARKRGRDDWEALLGETMAIIADAWGTAEFGVPSDVPAGILVFLRRHNNDTRYRRTRLIQVLRDSTPAAIAADGKAWASLARTFQDYGVMTVIVKRYNSRLNPENRLPEQA